MHVDVSGLRKCFTVRRNRNTVYCKQLAPQETRQCNFCTVHRYSGGLCVKCSHVRYANHCGQNHHDEMRTREAANQQARSKLCAQRTSTLGRRAHTHTQRHTPALPNNRPQHRPVVHPSNIPEQRSAAHPSNTHHHSSTNTEQQKRKEHRRQTQQCSAATPQHIPETHQHTRANHAHLQTPALPPTTHHSTAQ